VFFIGVHPPSFLHPLDSPWKDYEMRKGFTRRPQPDAPAAHVKNYITPNGLQRLKDEHGFCSPGNAWPWRRDRARFNCHPDFIPAVNLLMQ
jgi:hypothetical protein